MCPAPTSASELAAGLKTEKLFRPSDRVPELYAYTSVVSLAKKLRSDRDMFDEARPDLASSLYQPALIRTYAPTDGAR